MAANSQNVNQNSKSDDIMSVLLAHEKRANSNNAVNAVKALPGDDSDSSSDEMNEVKNDNEIGKYEENLYTILLTSRCKLNFVYVNATLIK